MWYLKKTAESVWNASMNWVDNRTPVQKLIDTIADWQQQILPTNKLSELSAMTYELETFEQITTILFDRLKKFNYGVDESQKTLNLLVATNYLVKNGATGFVDVFRKYIPLFKKYTQLESKKIYEQFVEQAKLDSNLEKVKSRSHHIQELLSDKQKLLKQKELSMLVKQKLKLYEKNKLSDLNNAKYSQKSARAGKGQQQSKAGQSDSKMKQLSDKAHQIFKNPQQLSAKLEGILENYLWRYVDKLDETIESASDRVMEQIDKYVNGEQPQPFELQEAEKFEEVEPKPKTKHEQDDEDLMKRLEEEVGDVPHVQNADLLSFEEVEQPPAQQKTNQVNQQLI